MGPDPEKMHSNNFNEADYVVNPLEDQEMEIDNGENFNNNGYMMLNQENGDNFSMAEDDDSDDTHSEDENVTESENPVNPPIIQVIRRFSTELAASLWNTTISSENIELTSEKSEQITQIMSNIKLPNPPAWLNDISTENILERIKSRGTDQGENKK